MNEGCKNTISKNVKMDNDDAAIVDFIVVDMTWPGCTNNFIARKRCLTWRQVQAGSLSSFSQHDNICSTIS